MKIRTMTTRLMTVVAALAVSCAFATPADAVRPVYGDQHMAAALAGECADQHLAWWGTLTVDGEVYGMALYHVSSEIRGQAYFYEEDFRVFTGLLDNDGDGVLDDCDPGEVVLSGSDRGIGKLANDTFRSNGTVDAAAGPFDGWAGRHIVQDGVIDVFLVLPDLPPIPAGFTGSLRLN
jgi:hypothetical protein